MKLFHFRNLETFLFAPDFRPELDFIFEYAHFVQLLPIEGLQTIQGEVQKKEILPV
jgi:hypothetical protein